MKNLKEMKCYLKEVAVDIREKKSLRKSMPHGFVGGLDDLRWTYRHYHIAYCLLRGTSMDRIENPHCDNQHCKDTVERILNKVKAEMEELENAGE